MAFTNTADNITAPSGATDRDPRIVFGSDVPTNIAHLDAAILFYAVDGNGMLVCHYYGIGKAPDAVWGAIIERGWFPATLTEPAYTVKFDQYMWNGSQPDISRFLIDAYRTDFMGPATVGPDRHGTQFTNYDLKGDANSSLLWDGFARFGATGDAFVQFSHGRGTASFGSKLYQGLDGTETISFASTTVFTKTITFTNPLPAKPIVPPPNINSQAGETAGWRTRAYNVSTTGFVLHISRDTAGAWSAPGYEVQWVALFG